MTLINILAVYAVYLVIILVAAHYFGIFTAKTEYTRKELTDMKPLVDSIKGKMTMKYSASLVVIIVVVTSLPGILLAHVPHWLFQSALVTGALFLALPPVRKYYMDRMVVASGEMADTAANIFVKYCHFIILGYGTGYGAGLMFYWSETREMMFLWFALNIVVTTALMVLTARTIMAER